MISFENLAVLLPFSLPPEKEQKAIYSAFSHEKIFKGVLNPGDSFGWLAIPFNEGIPTRSLEIFEDSIFVTLDTDYFLSLCRNYTTFQEDLTNAFGRCNAQQDFGRDQDKSGIRSLVCPFSIAPSPLFLKKSSV